jgi:RNA polymerase sigma-70 factor (ECF subfamily)
MFTQSTSSLTASLLSHATGRSRRDTHCEQREAGLYRTYGGAVFARCRRVLGDPHAAEDATQEVFLRVHHHLARVPDTAEALRWIYRVATNYCLNQLRDAKRRHTLDLEWRSFQPSASVDRPAADARWIMSKVPLNVASVAWLYHVDGMRQQEIAELLDISRRTVVARLGTFERHMRALLARDPA